MSSEFLTNFTNMETEESLQNRDGSPSARPVADSEAPIHITKESMTKNDQTFFEELSGTVDQIIRQIKELIQKGNARRIVIKSGSGKILFQSQLTMGIAGSAVLTVAAPLLTAITTILLLVNDVQVFVEKDENPDEDENEVEAECIEIESDDNDGEPENSDADASGEEKA